MRAPSAHDLCVGVEASVCVCERLRAADEACGVKEQPSEVKWDVGPLARSAGAFGERRS